MLCEKCGKDLSVGDWPFCDKSGHSRMGRFGFNPLEEGFDEHISTDGKQFTTWGEKLKYMDKNGIEPYKFREKRPGEVLYLDLKR